MLNEIPEDILEKLSEEFSKELPKKKITYALPDEHTEGTQFSGVFLKHSMDEFPEKHSTLIADSLERLLLSGSIFMGSSTKMFRGSCVRFLKGAIKRIFR